MAGKCPISITKDGNVANFSAIFSVYDIMALNISGIRYLDFAIDRFFVKLFKTNNITTVRLCQIQFGYRLSSAIIQKLRDSFFNKIKNSASVLFI